MNTTALIAAYAIRKNIVRTGATLSILHSVKLKAIITPVINVAINGTQDAVFF
jgi:hypothetical protein